MYQKWRIKPTTFTRFLSLTTVCAPLTKRYVYTHRRRSPVCERKFVGCLFRIEHDTVVSGRKFSKRKLIICLENILPAYTYVLVENPILNTVIKFARNSRTGLCNYTTKSNSLKCAVRPIINSSEGVWTVFIKNFLVDRTGLLHWKRIIACGFPIRYDMGTAARGTGFALNFTDYIIILQTFHCRLNHFEMVISTRFRGIPIRSIKLTTSLCVRIAIRSGQ